MGVKIITDSACDLTREYIDKNNVGLVSLVLNLNGETIKDDLRLDYKKLYNLMRDGVVSSTSQVNAHEFEEEFIKHVKNGDTVVCITLSSGLSGTFNSANIARNNILEEHPDAKIFLIDSLSVAMGQGLLVIKACEMKDRGLSAEEIVNWIEENKGKVVHSFVVDSLDYLKRGGRISSATAAIGGLLNIKPALYIDSEGKVMQGEKIKGKKKVLKHLAKEVKEKAINPENEILYIVHGDCIEEAEVLRDMILEEVKFKDVSITYVGAVIGSHSGPGALAVLFLGTERG